MSPVGTATGYTVDDYVAAQPGAKHVTPGSRVEEVVAMGEQKTVEADESVDTAESVETGEVEPEDVLVEEVSIDGMCGVY